VLYSAYAAEVLFYLARRNHSTVPLHDIFISPADEKICPMRKEASVFDSKQRGLQKYNYLFSFNSYTVMEAPTNLRVGVDVGG
jgi:hypothetical protein